MAPLFNFIIPYRFPYLHIQMYAVFFLIKATFLGLPVDDLWLPIAAMGAVTILCTGIAVKCFKWE